MKDFTNLKDGDIVSAYGVNMKVVLTDWPYEDGEMRVCFQDRDCLWEAEAFKPEECTFVSHAKNEEKEVHKPVSRMKEYMVIAFIDGETNSFFWDSHAAALTCATNIADAGHYAEVYRRDREYRLLFCTD